MNPDSYGYYSTPVEKDAYPPGTSYAQQQGDYLNHPPYVPAYYDPQTLSSAPENQYQQHYYGSSDPVAPASYHANPIPDPNQYNSHHTSYYGAAHYQISCYEGVSVQPIADNAASAYPPPLPQQHYATYSQSTEDWSEGFRCSLLTRSRHCPSALRLPQPTPSCLDSFLSCSAAPAFSLLSISKFKEKVSMPSTTGANSNASLLGNHAPLRSVGCKVPERKKAAAIGPRGRYWCSLCSIDCNSKEIFQKHISGKKHTRKLKLLVENHGSNSKAASQKFADSTPVGSLSESRGMNISGVNAAAGQIGAPLQQTGQTASMKMEGQKAIDLNNGKRKNSASDDINTKRQRVLECGTAVSDIKMCTICNVVCNSQTVLDFHLRGKKHATQVSMGSSVGANKNTRLSRNHATSRKVGSKVPERKKTAKPGGQELCSCSLCGIECNSKDMLQKHIVGKMHLKKLKNSTENKGSDPESVDQKVGNTTVDGLADNKGINISGKNAEAGELGAQLLQTCKTIDERSESEKTTDLKIEERSESEKATDLKIEERRRSESESEKATNLKIEERIEKVTDLTNGKKKNSASDDTHSRCKRLLDSGTDVSNMKTCTLCKIYCNSQAMLDIHLRGKKHATQVNKLAATAVQ